MADGKQPEEEEEKTFDSVKSGRDKDATFKCVHGISHPRASAPRRGRGGVAPLADN